MRICLVTDYFPGLHPHISGAELVCLRLGEMLVEEGHEVIYLTGPVEPDVHVPKGVYCLKTPFMGKRFIGSNFPVDIWAFWSAVRWLKELRPDIVHFVAKILFPASMRACMRLGIPTVFTVVDQYLLCPKDTLRRPEGAACERFHGAWCGSCVRYDSGGKMLQLLGIMGGGHIASWIRARYIDRLGRRLSAIVTLSETSKRRLVKYGFNPRRIYPIYHYKIHQIQSDNSSQPYLEPSLLYAGTLSEVRGPQVAIRAMAHVVREMPNAILRIVGHDTPERPYRPHLEKLVASLNLGKNVTFLGGKRNEEVIDFIRRSHLVVVPLQWPNEFGPVILLEAKCLGKPVVASKAGATPEFIDDGKDGFLVPHDQPEAFAERIVYLLQNPDYARRMGKLARESVSFLKGDSVVRKMIDLYQRVASSKGQGSDVNVSRIKTSTTKLEL